MTLADLDHVKEMPLFYRQAHVSVALVDDEDFDWLGQWRWLTGYVHRMTDEWGYAYRSTNRGLYPMARQIMRVPTGDPRVVHHMNEQKRDNRKANLRVCASSTEHLMLGHTRRPVSRRQVPRPSFRNTVPWSRELFEEASV